MNFIEEVLFNYVLLCSLLGWFSAQVIKVVTEIARGRRTAFNIRILVASGGMPSAHSATVCALSASVGRVKGFSSAEFALAFIFAYIVMYDASGVRRAAGEQARILNRMINDRSEDKPAYLEKNLKELIGHTPFEVLVGALLGILIVLVAPYPG